MWGLREKGHYWVDFIQLESDLIILFLKTLTCGTSSVICSGSSRRWRTALLIDAHTGDLEVEDEAERWIREVKDGLGIVDVAEMEEECSSSVVPAQRRAPRRVQGLVLALQISVKLSKLHKIWLDCGLWIVNCEESSAKSQIIPVEEEVRNVGM